MDKQDLNLASCSASLIGTQVERQTIHLTHQPPDKSNNSQLKITHFGIEEETNFDESEFESKLKHYFDIEIWKDSC